jgi:protein-disulfide isomerase
MPLPGNNERNSRETDDHLGIARASRSSRRNLLLIVAVLVGVVALRQFGFFDTEYQGEPLADVQMQEVQAMLGSSALVPRIGNPDGSVKIIEFFDYRCGHCRSMALVVDEVVNANDDIDLALIEFPVLGRESELAARYALAAELQGGYAMFHRALMFTTIPYTDSALMELGANLGLDADRLKEDAYGDLIGEVMLDNLRIAKELGVSGTPTFVIGDTLIVGTIDKASFMGLVSAARGP